MQLAALNMPSRNLPQKFLNMKAHLHFLKFIQKPTDTGSIFKMTQAFQKAAPPEMVTTLIQPLLANSSLEKDYQNRVWYSHPSIAELGGYPEGSFGKAVSNFFIKNNLDENLFPKADFSSLVNYITSRVYQTHDFWHILTSYSVGLEDELALQAFGVGQYKQPISLTIIAGGIIHILQKTPERSFEIMNAITEGYQRGLEARLLLDINIFEYLNQPLEQVQERLRIRPRAGRR